MRRILNQNQSKVSKLKEWMRENRAKTSILTFVILVVVGSVCGLIIKLTSPNHPQAATVQIGDAAEEIPGWWYQQYFGASVCEKDECKKDADPDEDKLSNAQEFYYNTNPVNRDTNNNGNTDGEDVAFGYAPNKPGKVTFEEAGSDDTIVGESLLFNDEVKDVIVGMTDLSKTVLPEVNEAELTITTQNTQDAFIEYMLALDRVSNKYYSANLYANLREKIQQHDRAAIDGLKMVALTVADEYKKVPVPSDALEFHKYQIALWSLLPKVIEAPVSDDLTNALYEDSVNSWFDNVQVMVVLNQKIYIETVKLRGKYEFVQ
jgi:hypothetical protein